MHVLSSLSKSEVIWAADTVTRACTYQKLGLSLGLATAAPLAGLHGMYLRAPARTAQAAAVALALGAATRGFRGLGLQLVRKCMNSCGCMGSL